MKKGFIYKITSPDGKVYIGETLREIEKRWNDYKKLYCISQPKIFNSLKKYGPENHVFEIIEETNENIIYEREIFWKIHYLNLVNGNIREVLFHEIYDRGGGNKSKETIEKMKEAQKGEKNGFFKKHHTEETKNILSKKHTNTHHTEDTKRKMSENRCGEKNSFYGKKHSIESKKLIGESSKDRKQLMEVIVKFSSKIEIDNIIYYSIREASRILKIDRKTISLRLKNDKYKNYKILINRTYKS